ncbi:hypothetical protein OROMI_013611 [Orobanche minor]
MGNTRVTNHLLLMNYWDHRIHVTLWGEYADQAKCVFYTRRNSAVIVLLQFCRTSGKR